MAVSPKRVCWDACVWIAIIQQEKIVEDGVERYTRCRSVLDRAKQGKLEVVCSALCLAEVCKNKDVKDGDPDKVAAYFEHDYILTVALGREIGEKARSLMMAGVAKKLKPADACHLATALQTPSVEEFHTFDADIRSLNNKLAKPDGSMLRICLPDVGGPPPPLLKSRKGS